MAKTSKLKKKPIVARKILLKKPKKKTKKVIVAKSTKVKSKKVSPIPKGYHSITPYLIVNNANQAIEFYKKIFGAKVVMRMEHPGNKVGHAELKIGDSKIMLADECPEMAAHSPHTTGGSPVGIHLYTKNVDAVIEKAIANGAKLIRPAEDMFFGDRLGTIEDPYGHRWSISTHIEDVTPAKIKKRMLEIFKNK